MKSTEQRKKQLDDRLQMLDARLHSIDENLTAEHSSDWDDLSIERADDEVLEGMGHSSQHEVDMIKAALDRIEAGDYGTCAVCGVQIAEKRLDILPFTPFCSTCAAEVAGK